MNVENSQSAAPAGAYLVDSPLATLAADLEHALADRETRDDVAAMAMQDMAWEIARAMIGRRAITARDLAAKARAVRFVFEDLLEGDGADARLLASLLADLEGLVE